MADPAGKSEPRRYGLTGNYEPEAFSTDDLRFYVLEYLPPEAPARYRVRQLDLTAGRVMPIMTRDKRVIEEEMRGRGRMQALAPDRRTLYTLYTRQEDHVHARDTTQAGGTGRPSGALAFVHVLSLDGGWAYCLDLPLPFGMGPAPAHALAVSPGGRWLFVADRYSGAIAVAGTERLALERIMRIKDVPPAGQAVTPLHADQAGRIYVVGGSEVLVLDDVTLNTRGLWLLKGPPCGGALSRDGRRLYAALHDRVDVFETSTGRLVGGFDAPGISGIIGVASGR